MKQSEQINEITKALAEAQKEIGAAHKDSKNPFFKSNYADLTSVIDACKEPLNKNGIAIVQGIDSDENGHYAETILSHESGQFMSCRMKLIVNKNDMQQLGSAITYARRYMLQSMAFVGAEDDDGNLASKRQVRKEIKKEQADTRIYTTDMLLNLIKLSGTEPTEATCDYVDGLPKPELRALILKYESEQVSK